MPPRPIPSVKNLKTALLAGTCLSSLASGAKAAGTVTESGDFSNTLSGAIASPLLTGTDLVNGNMAGVSDVDYFAFTNLLPGSPFSLVMNGVGGNYFRFEAFNSSDLATGTPSGPNLGTTSVTFTGTIPADGILVARVGYSEGVPYTVGLTATPAPEPASAMLAGQGGAAALLRRNRRTRRDD